MPIKEESFRIGCGRYLQEHGIIASLGEEILHQGSYPLIVGDKTALSITKDIIEKSVSKVCNKYEIAECLYDTDRYIYPEAFGDYREKAVKAMSRLIGMDGSLLDYKNLLIARYNGQICGICLISDGTGTWDEELIRKRMGDLFLSSQKDGFNYTSEEYFKKINSNTITENEIELVACSVMDGFRRKHIADALLNKLVELYKDKIIKLTVLSENAAAIRLYEKHGFVKSGDEYEGFAPQGLKRPMCFDMVKLPQ